MDSRLRGNDAFPTRQLRVIPANACPSGKAGVHDFSNGKPYQKAFPTRKRTAAYFRSDRRMNLRVSSKSPGSPKGLRKTVRTAPTMAA